MSHTHLSESERDCIAESLAKGKSMRTIADAIKRSPSTISREIRRNSTDGAYRALAAQSKASARKRGCPPRKMDDPKIAAAIKVGLRADHSPELIAGRLALLAEDIRIGKQTIYDWIAEEQKRGRKWHHYLPRRGKPYFRKRSGIAVSKGRTPIHERPVEVESRTTFGHWEGDTLEGRKGGDAVVTLVERKSRYSVLCKVTDRRAKTLNESVKSRFAWQRRFPRKTMTVDCGGEFANGTGLEKAFKADVYFTDPHSPWQKGTVEQTNGLLRRYLTKGFDRVTETELKRIEDRLNHRPRKCLGFRTPHEVLFDVTPT